MAPRGESLLFDAEERILLEEILEIERARLLVGIMHSDHRAYRDMLRQRLEHVEALVRRVHVEPELAQGQSA